MKSQDNESKYGCTIIIPTFNRPYRLRRVLSYYRDHQIKYRIIVADSSSKKNKKLNRKIISSFPQLDILYLDKFSPKVYPYRKFRDALNYVKTKYSVLCADDDFITPKGINAAINFLEANPDYSVALGKDIWFWVENKKSAKEFYWLPLHSYKSIEFSNPLDRMNFYILNYAPTFYGVHRTEIHRKVFGESAKFEKNLWFGELLSSLLTLYEGKLKFINSFYDAREYIPTSSKHRGKSICVAIKDYTLFDEEYILFKKLLAKYITQKNDLSLSESKKFANKLMATHLDKCCHLNTLCILKLLFYSLNLPMCIKQGVGGTYKGIRFLYRKIPFFI